MEQLISNLLQIAYWMFENSLIFIKWYDEQIPFGVIGAFTALGTFITIKNKGEYLLKTIGISIITGILIKIFVC